jgi:hypothetical protein
VAKVLLKKSSVADNAPAVGELEYGEIAVNYADGRIYYKNSSNQIKSFIDSDLLDATYIRSVLDDPTPELGGNLEIDGFTITNSTYGPGSYIALQKYYTGDSAQQAVIASRQDVNILIDTNNGSPNGRFVIRANDSDINTASIVFAVNELGNVDITGQVNMNLNKITGIGEPAATSDATTKLYVDNAVASVVGLEPYPTGDWGTVDSALASDAFGVVIGKTYDHMDPVGKLAYQDFGAVT